MIFKEVCSVDFVGLKVSFLGSCWALGFVEGRGQPLFLLETGKQ